MSTSLRAATRRLVRGEGGGATRFAFVFWLLASLGFAIASRASIGAAGILTFGALMLPMLVFTVVGRVVGAKGLSHRTAELSRIGAVRAHVAWTHVFVAVAASAIVAAVVGTLFVTVAHKSTDPALGADLAATCLATALCGATYASYFALGSTFRAGLGRSLFLGLDWVVGGTGGLSMLVPRAHLRSLLGGDNVAALKPAASLLTVSVLGVVFAALAVWRARRKAR